MSTSAKIPHSRPLLGEEEKAAVAKVLESGQLAQGPEVDAFEAELAAFLRVPHAVALSNGTAALHLALISLGARPGKVVILPSYSCVSLLNAVSYTGATAQLIDSLPASPDMDIEQALRAVGENTVAVVVPHLFGRAVSCRALLGSAPVLEDATQSLGAISGKSPVGTAGLAGVFSFYATKMLAGGEAGALVTRRKSLANFATDHRDYDYRPQWKVRYNYKMSDLTAALLRVQLRRLPWMIQRRQALAEFYNRELAGLELLPAPSQGVSYRYTIQVDRPLDALIEALEKRGVSCRRPVFRPIHQYLKQASRAYPRAQRWWRRCLSVPLYPALQDEEAERVVLALRKELG